MKFGKSGTLKHHLMTHTGNSHFIMDKKKYFDLYYIFFFEKGEKPHACEIVGCGKRFIQNVALKAHMKTHKKNSAILLDCHLLAK
jgi:uncharacterized Zn-finger protein